MIKKFLRIGILSAAVAAVPVLVFSSDAAAQYRVNQDGQALDANSRIGSNGNNNETGIRNSINGNDIVTGNVSDGKQFRGFVPYRNARDFRGAAPGIGVDNFIRQSTSAADLGTVGSPYRVVPFYGKSLTVDPPPNAVPSAIGSGAYTVPTLAPGQFNRPLAGLTGDARLGATEVGPQPLELPGPGQLLLPGPVDPAAGQQFIS